MSMSCFVRERDELNETYFAENQKQPPTDTTYRTQESTQKNFRVSPNPADQGL